MQVDQSGGNPSRKEIADCPKIAEKFVQQPRSLFTGSSIEQDLCRHLRTECRHDRASGVETFYVRPPIRAVRWTRCDQESSQAVRFDHRRSHHRDRQSEKSEGSRPCARSSTQVGYVVWRRRRRGHQSFGQRPGHRAGSSRTEANPSSAGWCRFGKDIHGPAGYFANRTCSSGIGRSQQWESGTPNGAHQPDRCRITVPPCTHGAGQVANPAGDGGAGRAGSAGTEAYRQDLGEQRRLVGDVDHPVSREQGQAQAQPPLDGGESEHRRSGCGARRPQGRCHRQSCARRPYVPREEMSVYLDPLHSADGSEHAFVMHLSRSSGS